MANILFILNGPPYGNEHSYNGLRLAGHIARRNHLANEEQLCHFRTKLLVVGKGACSCRTQSRLKLSKDWRSCSNWSVGVRGLRRFWLRNWRFHQRPLLAVSPRCASEETTLQPFGADRDGATRYIANEET